ncbi:TadA family conjugal transfer-associated ATPase [Tsukamurella soli]|uniref:TadA family conjugal transfer-associated ATPase n=1 Tax=Tsukamurella soli TaxID=644556 RepID=A0ABP8JCV5_9ACTN
MSGDLLSRVRDRLAHTAGDLTPDVMAEALRAECGGVLGDTELLDGLAYLETELVGAGRLEPLLGDPDVADVLVVGAGHVWADRGRGLERTPIEFEDDDAVRRLATRLALAAGRRLDDAQPWVDGHLPAAAGTRGRGGRVGVRLHAVLPPLATNGTCISLRVLRPATQSLDALIASGAVPDEIAGVVRDIVRARLAFLVTGGTGSGKTTLLSGMLGAVDPAERILCIEDARELDPVHPHVVSLLARGANVEGAGAVTVRDLVRQALRMRPDRIVVGEVRGAEVVDLLTALNTGHDGGAGTVHANAPAEVPARLEALAALGGMGRAALHSQLAAAVQAVVEVHRSAAGVRGVRSVGTVVRGADGLVAVTPVWHRGTGFTPAADGFRALLDERAAR